MTFKTGGSGYFFEKRLDLPIANKKGEYSFMEVYHNKLPTEHLLQGRAFAWGLRFLSNMIVLVPQRHLLISLSNGQFTKSNLARLLHFIQLLLLVVSTCKYFLQIERGFSFPTSEYLVGERLLWMVFIMSMERWSSLIAFLLNFGVL